jgi:hypothetical protein
MSTISAPFGFRPVQRAGYAHNSGGVRWIKAAVDTGAIAKGGLASLAATGDVVACTAAGTTTRDANTPIGVVMGVRYVDPTGRPGFSAYLPANAVTAGYTAISIQICEDENMLFEVQAAGSLSTADVGANVSPATFTVDTTKKLSNTTVTSPAVTTTAMFRIVDIVEDATNTSGDAFTRVRVRFNPGYHAYNNAVGL